MIWTTTQVAEKLGITKASVKKLVKAGSLTDLRADANGKRHTMQFNSAEVNNLKKSEAAPAPKVLRASRTTIVDAGDGPPTILKRIEAKLDRLLAMWA